MKIKKPMGATVALLIGLGGLGFASPAFADEAVAPEVVAVEETAPAEAVTEEVAVDEVAAAKTTPATPATPAVPDKGPKTPKPEVDPTPYLTIAWQMTSYVDATTGVFPGQKILGFVETATPNLDAADGFLANAKCGTGVQFDVNHDDAVSRALIAGGVLNGPGTPQESLISGGWGVAYKVLPTAACVVVPEKPAPVVESVTTTTHDCTTVTDTLTTTTTTTDWVLDTEANVWVKSDAVVTTEVTQIAGNPEECPVVTPEEPEQPTYPENPTPVEPEVVTPVTVTPVAATVAPVKAAPVASTERLASTGSDITGPGLIGGLLLAAGLGALAWSRRKAVQL
jgi:LPXTG-motif cell wall-anchored protein